MGRPKSTRPKPPTPRAAKKPDLKPIQVQLGSDDLSNLDRIAGDLARRDQSMPSRSRAMRWAIRELAQRLWFDKAAKLESGAMFTGPGPISAPPEP